MFKIIAIIGSMMMNLAAAPLYDAELMRQVYASVDFMRYTQDIQSAYHIIEDELMDIVQNPDARQQVLALQNLQEQAVHVLLYMNDTINDMHDDIRRVLCPYFCRRSHLDATNEQISRDIQEYMSGIIERNDILLLQDEIVRIIHNIQEIITEDQDI